MRKVTLVVGFALVFLVFPASLMAQTYLVDNFANNAGPGTTADALLSLINVAAGGSPLTSPVGDVCANIYVFDATQEMISCCSCYLTPNQLATASVSKQLTNNALVSIPTTGVIKIMPTKAETAVCNPAVPSTPSDASLVRGFVTHLEITGGATFITETNIPSAPLGSDEAAFLSNACLFVTYLGSGYGKGACSCSENPVNTGTGTYSISGTISGAGGSGATINLTGYSTATVTADAAGNYIFTGLGIGSYTVIPSKAGFTFTPTSQPATVTREGTANVTGVNFSTVIPYATFVQPPINADGSSVFKANRGALPVKFTLTHNNVPTCTLPPATISVTRIAGGTLGPVGESVYSAPADNGSNFRIDATACQYIYNIGASSLGVGTYRVDININGIAVGHVMFALN